MRELGGLNFASSVAALIGHPFGPGDRLAVAVSGGPDSLALLLLARSAFGDRVSALTVDHGLRAGSADEAAMVASVCASLGVPHVILRWEGLKPTANLQAEAREARYRLMADWCAGHGIGWLATAHHADDQAETLLMRLARGAGLAGLGGIRAARRLTDDVSLIRPLRQMRRAALAAVVADAGLVGVDDPSNRDAAYDRTRARALLGETAWLDAGRLAASADHLADAEAALEWAAEAAWRSRCHVGDAVTVDAAGLPRELVRRLVLRALGAVDPAGRPDGPQVQRLLAALESGGTATLGGVRATGGTVWRFAPARPRRDGSRQG